MSSVNRLAGNTMGRSIHFMKENIRTITTDVSTLQDTIGDMSNMIQQLEQRVRDLESRNQGQPIVNKKSNKSLQQSNSQQNENEEEDTLFNDIVHATEFAKKAMNGKSIAGISFSNDE
jgi:septal ring factor EnvC (AmiA/AmiB activator)